jgi:hypothetical protein
MRVSIGVDGVSMVTSHQPPDITIKPGRVPMRSMKIPIYSKKKEEYITTTINQIRMSIPNDRNHRNPIPNMLESLTHRVSILPFRVSM